MPARRGLTISSKMILTSVGLIALIVVLFAYLNYVNVTRAYREAAQRQRQTFEQSIRDAGSAQIIAFSEPSKAAMQEENWAAIRQFVVPIRKRDPRILFIWVANNAGKIVASADKKENEKLSKSLAEDFLKDPARKALVDPRLIPKPGAEKVERFRIPGAIKRFRGQRVMVVGERLVEQGVYLGSVVLVYSLRQLDELEARLERQRVQASRKAFVNTALVGALFLAVGVLLAILQGLSISRPIRALAARATQIAQGDLAARVDVNVGGELGQLADNFNYMADQIVILLNETAAKATMEKELEVARTIQETLVPGEDVVDRRVIQLAGFFEPAAECGGDWWSYVDLKGDKLLVIIGDVTGHGVPSAMITASAKSAVDTLRFVTDKVLDVRYLLEILNKAIYESAKRQFVMTCFASLIDLKTLEIQYANAGHNFPYLLREVDGRPKFSVLMTRGNRLGDILDSTYEAKTERLQPGDVLVWYTDGVVECENAQGEEFGEKRFRGAIRRARDKTVAEMREIVVAEAKAFYGDVPHKDDITVVFGKVYAPGQAPPVPAGDGGASS